MTRLDSVKYSICEGLSKLKKTSQMVLAALIFFTGTIVVLFLPITSLVGYFFRLMFPAPFTDFSFAFYDYVILGLLVLLILAITTLVFVVFIFSPIRFLIRAYKDHRSQVSRMNSLPK
jgi:hypothetical protein